MVSWHDSNALATKEEIIIGNPGYQPRECDA